MSKEWLLVVRLCVCDCSETEEVKKESQKQPISEGLDYLQSRDWRYKVYYRVEQAQDQEENKPYEKEKDSQRLW